MPNFDVLLLWHDEQNFTLVVHVFLSHKTLVKVTREKGIYLTQSYDKHACTTGIA